MTRFTVQICLILILMTIAVSLHRITIRKRTTMPFNHTATRKRTGCVKMCVSGSSLVSGSSSSLRVPSFQKAKAVKNHASPIRACDVCSLTFTKPYQFDEHMSGKRHAENLKKWLSPGQLLEEFTLSAPHWVTGVTADMLAPLWDKEELSSLGLKSRFSTLHPSQMVSQLSPYQKARMWRYLRDRMGVNHYTEVATILAAVDAHKDGHLRVKEVIESFETYAVLANFIVASRRTQAASDQAPPLDRYVEMGCGHGLVGLLIAYRFPDMQVVLYDLQKRRGFDVLVEAFELHGHHGKGQTKALPNVIFREADMLEAPSRGDITPSSLVVAIHGCNEVNQDSIEMALQENAAWAVMPCCIQQGMYLEGCAVQLRDDDDRDTRHTLMCGAMASQYGAQLVAHIDRRVTNRAIVIMGGVGEGGRKEEKEKEELKGEEHRAALRRSARRGAMPKLLLS